MAPDAVHVANALTCFGWLMVIGWVLTTGLNGARWQHLLGWGMFFAGALAFAAQFAVRP